MKLALKLSWIALSLAAIAILMVVGGFVPAVVAYGFLCLVTLSMPVFTVNAFLSRLSVSSILSLWGATQALLLITLIASAGGHNSHTAFEAIIVLMIVECILVFPVSLLVVATFLAIARIQPTNVETIFGRMEHGFLPDFPYISYWLIFIVLGVVQWLAIIFWKRPR